MWWASVSPATKARVPPCIPDFVWFVGRWSSLRTHLQDSPDEVPELERRVLEDGFDLVSGWKKKRYDPITKTVPTKLYNWATRKVSGIHLHDFNCGLKAYRREVVRAVEVNGEMHRYIPVLAKQAGFSKIGEQVVQHRARKYGTTKFGLERFVNGFLDLLTIAFIGRFGHKPMHLFGVLGTLTFLVGSALFAAIGGYKLWPSARGWRPATSQRSAASCGAGVHDHGGATVPRRLGELVTRTILPKPLLAQGSPRLWAILNLLRVIITLLPGTSSPVSASCHAAN